MFKNLKRFLSVLIIAVLLLQGFVIRNAFADEQSAPYNLAINDKDASGKAVTYTGYNEKDGYYIDLKWEVKNMGVGTYCNIYVQEIDKTVKPRTLVVKNIPYQAAQTVQTYRLGSLKPGTIYYIDVTAYNKFLDGYGNVLSSSESVASNRIKVMTDIDIDAYSYGTNQIKIEWDDVWGVGKRIDYKLYVSEDSSFNNTPPIYINPSQIGDNGPIIYNSSTDKLEYIHNVRDAGRVYYVKIVPDIADTEIKHNTESETVLASSFILVKTTRMSQTDAGVIWKLDWSPVVTGFNSSDIEVKYQIYKGDSKNNSISQYVAETDTTNYIITLPPEGDENYYEVWAVVTRKLTGKEVYPGIKIKSDKVFIREQEIPATPSAPEIVNQFERAENDIIISYSGLLKPNEATILWRIPKKGNGEIDNDIMYDIWLIKNPDNINNPPLADKIASSVKMGAGNIVYDNNAAVGYKYNITGLTPNTTYYFKIVAKKQYLDYVNGYLQNVELTSEASMKVVITPNDSSMEQPLVPGRPPLKLRVLPGDKLDVTTNSAVVQIKDRWFEKYDSNTNKWNYITDQEYMTAKAQLDTIKAQVDAAKAKLDTAKNQLANSEITQEEYNKIKAAYDEIEATYEKEKIVYRKVQYSNDVTINVGCVEYKEGITDYSKFISENTADKIVNFKLTTYDGNENPNNNAPNDDGTYSRHNVNIPLTGLDPNKTYVVWVRAERSDLGLESGPSDPIIVTTLPAVQPPLEKPTVPVFSYGRASDKYVDLVWNFNPKYDYELKYGTVDNPDLAGQPINITGGELLLKSYYRVEGLNEDTTYYFWIRARPINDKDDNHASYWSDSLAVKTLPLQPPETPKGFGLKNSGDAITKSSITYQWVKENDLEYVIEISVNISYTNSKEYTVGKVSEYTVTGLLPNHRYYARLYAYDSTKKLRSLPTQSISIKTSRSNDEYDSDQDRDNVITGDFIEIDKEVNNLTWNIKIVGVNADRFIEHMQTDRQLDYLLDLSFPPSKVEKTVITISAEVFNALDMLKENLTIKTAENSVVIRHDMFSEVLENEIGRKYGDFNYRLTIEYPLKISTSNLKGMTLKKNVTGINIDAVAGNNSMPVHNFSNPLKIEVPYDSTSYKNGSTTAVAYNSAYNRWDRLNTTNKFSTEADGMQLVYETLNTGSFSVAEKSNAYFDDIQGSRYESSINNVTALYELKSVKGRFFEPDKNATLSDAVKYMLDILKYDYSGNYMLTAAKSGLITVADAGGANTPCTREKAISMVVRAYEIKTGQKYAAVQNEQVFKDMNDIEKQYKAKVEFAVENGMVSGRGSGMLGPKDQVTRGEIMELLERMLALNGEIV